MYRRRNINRTRTDCYYLALTSLYNRHAEVSFYVRQFVDFYQDTPPPIVRETPGSLLTLAVHLDSLPNARFLLQNKAEIERDDLLPMALNNGNIRMCVELIRRGVPLFDCHHPKLDIFSSYASGLAFWSANDARSRLRRVAFHNTVASVYRLVLELLRQPNAVADTCDLHGTLPLLFEAAFLHRVDLSRSTKKMGCVPSVRPGRLDFDNLSPEKRSQ